jgi:hypothetical protein
MATRKKADTSKDAGQTTVAQQLWDKIKDIPIDLYALPNQTVKQHVVREEKLEKAVPDALHLILKSAAVLPALEESLYKVPWGEDERGPLTFDLSQTHKYTVLKIVPKDI